MRFQTLLMLAFSLFTLISALPNVHEVEHHALEARAKKKTKPHPHPKPLPPKNRPKPKQQPHEPKEVKCDPISKYSTSWFVAHACKRPQKSKCLFYTRGLSKTARAYGKKNGMITIWDMWSSDLYDNSITKKNKLRCIMQSKGERGHMRQYFRNMSRAMAAMCDVFATVMDKNINPQHKDFDTVVQNGIWYKTEFPQLYLGGLGKRVTQIEAISPDGNTAFTYWTQGGHPQSEKRNEGLTFGSNVSFNHTAFDDEFDADFEFDDAEWDDSWFDEDDFDDDFEEDESLDLRSLDARAAKCPLKPGTTDSRAGSFDIGGSHPIAW